MNLKINLYLRKLANILTLFRLFLVIPISIFLSNGKILISIILIVLGGFTDFYDGYLARLAGGGSKWGSQVDPLADKVMLLPAIIYITSIDLIPLWASSILISREIFVSAWRKNDIRGGPASMAGKCKTILQFISIILLLISQVVDTSPLVIATHQFAMVIFWASFVLALLSAYSYFNIQEN